MVLSSWHSHCESSLASFDECSTVPSGFFQFVVQLFDEYRYIYPAPDVDVPQRASTGGDGCGRLDVRLFDTHRRAGRA